MRICSPILTTCLFLVCSGAAADVPWSQQIVDSLSANVPLYLRGLNVRDTPTLVYLHVLPNSYAGSVITSEQQPDCFSTGRIVRLLPQGEIIHLGSV